MPSPSVTVLGFTLVHFLWQGAVVGLVLWILLLFIRKPQWRYLSATVALLMLLLAPIITYLLQPSPYAVLATPISIRDDGMVMLYSDVNLSHVVEQRLSLSNLQYHYQWYSFKLSPYLPIIVMLWLMIVLILSLRLWGGYLWLRKLRRDIQTITNTEIVQRFAQLKEQIGIRQDIALHISSHINTPLVIGIFKPIILLPTSTVLGLSTAQLEAILIHELAHIKRHDYLINLLQHLCETLFFYHPVVWWVSRVMRHEREICCDVIAVNTTHQPKIYAQALTILLEHNYGAQHFAPSATGGNMYQRMKNILNLSNKPSRYIIVGIVNIIVLAAVVFGVFALAQTRQEQATREETLLNGVRIVGERPPLWFTFAGDIRFDSEGFTVHSTPEQPAFFIIQEVGAQNREFRSNIAYDQNRETRINYSDLEPWLMNAFHYTRRFFPREDTRFSFNSNGIHSNSYSSDQQPIAYRNQILATNFVDALDSLHDVDTSIALLDVGTQPRQLLSLRRIFVRAAQYKAHNLATDEAVLEYLDAMHKQLPHIPEEVINDFNLLISTLDNQAHRNQARALFN